MKNVFAASLMWFASVASSITAHELSDHEQCKTYERRLYNLITKHDVLSFGSAVNTRSAYGERVDGYYKYTSFFDELLGNEVNWDGSFVPLIAKLARCENVDGPADKYAEDPEYCIVPRMPEVEQTEGWMKLLDENLERVEFREICPVVYSETEKKLFMFDQKSKDTDKIGKSLVSWVGNQLMWQAYSACSEEKKSQPLFKERLAKMLSKSAKNPSCQRDHRVLHLNSGSFEKSCPEMKNDPRDEVSEECDELKKSAPEVLQILEFYHSL